MMPPPDHAGAVEVDRKAALAAAGRLETPSEAAKRITSGGPVPPHYIPRPPVHAAGEPRTAVGNPYK
jgi:hypothetical protein